MAIAESSLFLCPNFMSYQRVVLFVFTTIQIKDLSCAMSICFYNLQSDD